MKQQVSSPNYSFLAQSWLPGEKLFETFRIDQFVPDVTDYRSRERITNQVESHLSHLAAKTGLEYSLLYWANPERVDWYIESECLTID